jgi:hypothetical protein
MALRVWGRSQCMEDRERMAQSVRTAGRKDAGLGTSEGRGGRILGRKAKSFPAATVAGECVTFKIISHGFRIMCHAVYPAFRTYEREAAIQSHKRSSWANRLQATLGRVWHLPESAGCRLLPNCATTWRHDRGYGRYVSQASGSFTPNVLLNIQVMPSPTSSTIDVRQKT